MFFRVTRHLPTKLGCVRRDASVSGVSIDSTFEAAHRVETCWAQRAMVAIPPNAPPAASTGGRLSSSHSSVHVEAKRVARLGRGRQLAHRCIRWAVLPVFRKWGSLSHPLQRIHRHARRSGCYGRRCNCGGQRVDNGALLCQSALLHSKIKGRAPAWWWWWW